MNRKVGILFIIVMILATGLVAAKNENNIKKGYLDLREYTEEEMVSLDGDWEFYWKQLLTPSDFSKQKIRPTRFIKVPSNWNDYRINNQRLGSYGYATFKKTIRLADTKEIKAIKISAISSAYKLWVNNRLVATGGTIATNRSESVPDYTSHIVYFKPEQEELSIVIQTSNYVERLGGILKSIEFGSLAQAKWERKKELAFEMFLFGSLLIMAIYHFSLYYFRQQKKAPLYLALFCLVLALRTIIVNEIFLADIVSGLNWQLHVRLEYLTFFLGIPLIVAFINQLYPKENYSKLVIANWVLGIIFSLIAILLPFRIANFTIPIYRIIAIFSFVYLIYVIILAILKKRKGAFLFAGGLISLIAAAINDILYYLDLSSINNLTPFGLLFFIFIQSLVLARNYANAFQQIEALSQKLLSLDKLKDEFLANTSHELKTPLNGIIGIAQSMLDGATGRLNHKQRNNLNMIMKSGSRLSNLVNDILDFSKLKNSDLTIKRSAVDIYQIVKLVLEMSRPLVNDKNLKVINKVDKDSPYLYGDEDRLQQILYNLVGNAIKFTNNGLITVDAKKINNNLEIKVADTGEGIAPEQQNKIFKSFEQLDGSTTREFGGTGLGLTITKKLIELHQGQIKVESEVGVGSEFIFTIPIYRGQEDCKTESIVSNNDLAMVEEVEPELVCDFAGELKGNILVADDDKINRQVLSNQLSVQGYQVKTVNNGIEALSALKEVDYDLLILDIMMPKLSGYEVARKIREETSMFKLPILMLTAKNQAKDIAASFKVGANDHLAKPVSKNELLARVNSLLELKNAVSRSISQMKKLEAEKQQRILVEKLHQLMERLTASLNLKSVADELLTGLEGLFNYESAVMLLKESEKMRPISQRGELEANIDYCNQKIIKELKSNFEAIIDNESCLFKGESSCLALPLLYQQQLMGIVVLSRTRNKFKPEDKKISLLLSSQGGIAIKNALLFGQLTEKTKAVENLLNNAGQGFLSCSSNLVVDDEYSQECKSIFESDIAGAKLNDLIYPNNEDEQQFLAEIIPVILSTSDKDKYLDLLPQEEVINAKNIKLEFKVIEKDQKTKLMVVLTDITEKREVENQVEKERQNLRIVVKAVTNYDDFVYLINDYRGFFTTKLDQILATKESITVKLNYIYRKIHTFKGSLAQFDVTSVAAKLNDLEDQIELLGIRIEQITEESLREIFAEFDCLDWLETEMDLLKEVLGPNFFNKKGQLIVDSQQILKIEEKILDILPTKEQEKLLPEIRELRYKSISELLEGYRDYVSRLADKVNKRINPLIIEDNGIKLDPLIYDDFIKSLGHIFRNSIDHGLEAIDKRNSLAKNNKGTINCYASRKQDYIKLTIADDGAGLDLEEIKEQAVNQGLYNREEIAELSETEVKKLIFTDELSTKDEITDLSGRGVGLAAVKHEVEELGGFIKVDSKLGTGTKFEFWLPELNIHDLE